MIYRFSCLLLVVFSVVISCSSALKEQEPNNTIESANFINFPFSIKGRLNNGMDIDFFKFKVKNDLYCYFSISNIKGFDTQIEIFDSSGKLLKKVDDYPRNFGESLFVFLKKGDYIIKISPSPNDYKSDRPVVIASDEYTLVGDSFSFNFDYLEKEPNDYINLANNLPISFDLKKIYGFYKPVINKISKGPLDYILNYVSTKINKDITYQDIDVFEFSVKEKGSFLLKVWVNDLPNYDPVLILFSEDDLYSFINEKKMEKIYFVDSNSYDRGEGIVNFKIDGTKKYYFVITGIARLNYETIEEVLKNPYSLNFMIQPLSNLYEIEPNNSIDSANIISSNVIKGFLNPSTDVDFYLFNGDEASFSSLSLNKESSDMGYKIAGIEIISPKDLDLSLQIYSEDGKLLKIIDNSGIGGKEEIPNLLLEKGKKLFFAVKGGKDNYLDNFVEEYLFKIRFNEGLESGFEAEPNDEPNQNLKYNTFSDAILGFINNKGDIDNFYCLIPDMGKYLFVFDNIESPLIVRVYDFKNFLIKEIKIDSKNNQFDILVPTKQVLRVSIQASDRNYFNTQNPYKIFVRGI